MNKAYKFNMINRTVEEQLPDCIFYEYDESIRGYKIEFHGGLDIVSDIPLRLDIAINNTILVGNAVHKEVKKNCTEYVAEYHAYALHLFPEGIPS